MEILIYAILWVKQDSVKLDTLLNGMKGFSGGNLHAVSTNEIAAVVCESETSRIETDRAGVIDYAGVIETLSRQFPLLPMRYGSKMESITAINLMLERNYSGIHLNLQQVEDKFEFGLKVFCDSEKLRADLMAKSRADDTETPLTLPESPNSIYKDWINKKLKEHRLEEMLLKHVDSVIAILIGQLTQMNARCKFKKMASETMIIDAVFLLEKRLKDELILKTEELQNRYPGLNFILTGPWPPYNFVEITIT